MKNTTKKFRIPTGLKVLLFIIAVIAGMYIYDVPIQRIKAEKAVSEYMAIQGADESSIESKRVLKDWTQNGHNIYITYTDDPGMLYNYHYKKSGKIHLMVNETRYGLPVTNPRYLKYPPLPYQ